MEILSPAGSFRKLKYAVYYGADAVYTAGKTFGLRAKAGNLSNSEIIEAVTFCHAKGVRLYVTVNIFAHNRDYDKLPEYLAFLKKAKVDAVIVSDPGVFQLAIEAGLEVHISTQANTVSWRTVKFWKDQGASRVILARELTFVETQEIREHLPDYDIEIFVHGAMCISYSGRCLLSAFFNDRSANSGSCTQVCRWEMQLVEKSRPNQQFQIEEDSRGSYILNSKDLNLIYRIPEIYSAGIASAKIEGRMKSLYYAANTARIYKAALEHAKSGTEIPEKLAMELDSVTHRVYSEGFYNGFDASKMQDFEKAQYLRTHTYIGAVLHKDKHYAKVEVKNKFVGGDILEIIFPNPDKDLTYIVNDIFNLDCEIIKAAQPNMTVLIPLEINIPEHGLIRRADERIDSPALIKNNK